MSIGSSFSQRKVEMSALSKVYVSPCDFLGHSMAEDVLISLKEVDRYRVGPCRCHLQPIGLYSIELPQSSAKGAQLAVRASRALMWHKHWTPWQASPFIQRC